MEGVLDGHVGIDGWICLWVSCFHYYHFPPTHAVSYDTGQISGFLSMVDFLRRFGQRHDDGTPYFSNVRSGLIVGLLSIGTLFGALIAAPIADWIGRKMSIIWWCGIFSVGIIVQIAATDEWYQVMMGRFVAGLGVGALSLLVPMYQVRKMPRRCIATADNI